MTFWRCSPIIAISARFLSNNNNNNNNSHYNNSSSRHNNIGTNKTLSSLLNFRTYCTHPSDDSVKEERANNLQQQQQLKGCVVFSGIPWSVPDVLLPQDVLKFYNAANIRVKNKKTREMEQLESSMIVECTREGEKGDVMCRFT